MTTLNPLEQTSSKQEDWKSQQVFYAKTTLQEKVWRVANVILLAATLVAVYSLVTGSFTIISAVTLALATRKVIAIVIGYIAFPASLFSYLGSYTYNHKLLGCIQIFKLKEEGFSTRQLSIYRSGTKYDAILIGKEETLDNKKWTLHAFGNFMPYETAIESYAKEDALCGSNTLLINGPGVVNSGGFPTPYQMSGGLEAGLQYLEDIVGATHIAMRGLSLGGGMMGEAIMSHDFDHRINKGTTYMFISDRTFSRLSDIAASFTTPFVRPLCTLVGQELDNVAAAERATSLGIEHIIIQHKDESDGVIRSEVALDTALLGAWNRTFLRSTEIEHNDILPEDIQSELHQKRIGFFNTPIIQQ